MKIIKSHWIGILGIVLILIGIGYPLGILNETAFKYTLYPGLVLVLISTFLKKDKKS